MNVLFWSEKYLPDIGGVEVFGASLIETLRNKGYTFSVITCRSNASQPDEDVVDGVPVFRFPFHVPLYGKDLAGVTRLCRRVSDLKREIKPDVIHMNTTQPSIFYHVHTVKSCDRPTLVTIHSPPTFVKGPHSLYGRLVRDARLVTAVSDATRRALVEAVPDIEERTITLYNGLTPPGLTPTPPPFEPIHIVCAGRLVREKGFDVALQAFRSFLESHPDALMTIAGDGADRIELEEFAADIGVAGSVTFRGWVEREAIPSLMNSATMVMVPSRWQEPFGLVALQASQVARPVIATRVGGLPEVVADLQTGLVVEPEDPGALLHAMRKLSENRDLARRLGEQGRERAIEQFTMAGCADRYDAVYRRVAT